MGFWTRERFKKHLANIFKEHTYTPDSLDRASYTLRLGKDVFLSGSEVPLVLSESNPYVSIKPGDYALLTTCEYITMPSDSLGLITLRYRYKKMGLMNVSGFHVDPNFHGVLVFSVFNVGTRDVVLKFQDKMFMLFMASLQDEPVKEQAESKEESQPSIDLQPHEHDGQRSFSLEDVIAIHGRSTTLVQIDSRISAIERTLAIYGTIVIGVLLVLLVSFVGFLVRHG